MRRVPEWLVWPSCRHNWTFEGTRTAPGALSCVCCEKRESQEQADESLDLSAGASRDENSVDQTRGIKVNFAAVANDAHKGGEEAGMGGRARADWCVPGDGGQLGYRSGIHGKVAEMLKRMGEPFSRTRASWRKDSCIQLAHELQERGMAPEELEGSSSARHCWSTCRAGAGTGGEMQKGAQKNLAAAKNPAEAPTRRVPRGTETMCAMLPNELLALDVCDLLFDYDGPGTLAVSVKKRKNGQRRQGLWPRIGTASRADYDVIRMSAMDVEDKEGHEQSM